MNTRKYRCPLTVPLNHNLQHSDTLADEYDAILNLREIFDGLVIPDGNSYAGHNTVVFRQDHLENLTGSLYTANSFSAATSGFFCAFKLNLPRYPEYGADWGVWNNGRRQWAAAAYSGVTIAIASDGRLYVYARNTGTTTPQLYGFTAFALPTGTDLTVHVSVDATDGDDAVSSLGFGGGTVVDFAADWVTGSHTLTVDDVVMSEGNGFTVTQTSPAQLTFDVATPGGNVVLFPPMSHIRVWVNGVAQFVMYNTDDTTTDSFNFSAANVEKCAIGAMWTSPGAGSGSVDTTSRLGYVDGASNDVDVPVEFLIWDDAPNPDPSTTSNNGADIDLSAFASGGATPAQVFFGGTQVAADWNAGTNQGDGSDFTMSGSVA